jgi:exosortase
MRSDASLLTRAVHRLPEGMERNSTLVSTGSEVLRTCENNASGTGIRNVTFILLCGAGVALFHHPVTEILRSTFQNELYSHISLIPFISVYFFLMGWKKFFGEVKWDLKKGVPLLVFPVLLQWSVVSFKPELNENDSLSLMMAGLFVWIVGSFLSVFGVPSTKRAAFPLFFLALIIPFPTFIIDPVVTTFQLGSAEAAHHIFKLTGIPVFREGVEFSLPGLDIEVARQCSGIRSGIALFITAIFVGKLFLERGCSRLILAVSVFPIAMFKNGLRIATLSLLSLYVDPGFIGGSLLHKSGGTPFFVLALLFLLPVLWGLRRVEKRENRIQKTGDRSQNAGGRRQGRQGWEAGRVKAQSEKAGKQ